MPISDRITLLICVGLAFCAQLSWASTESTLMVDGLAIDGAALEHTPEALEKPENIFETDLKELSPAKQRRTPNGVQVKVPELRRGSRSEVARRYMEKAQNYWKVQQWSKALEQIELALKNLPNAKYILEKAAPMAALAGDRDKSWRYFDRLITRYPNNIRYLVGGAGVLMRMNRLQEAQELAWKARELKPDGIMVRFINLCLNVATGTLNKDNEERWDDLLSGQLEMLLNWFISDQEDLVKIAGPKGFSQMVDTVIGEGMADKLPDALGSLQAARLAIAKGQWAVAERKLAHLIQLNVKTLGVAMDLAYCKYNAGQKEKALALMSSFTMHFSDNGLLWYNYGYILLQMQQYDQCVDVFSKAVEFQPKNSQAKFALACSYVLSEEKEQAWSILRRLAESHPAKMRVWLEGEKPYLLAIKNDPRYEDLEIKLGR